MKCNAPIDRVTGFALNAQERKEYAARGDLSFCDYDLLKDDVFCPKCGCRVERIVHHSPTQSSRTCGSGKTRVVHAPSEGSSLHEETGELLKGVGGLLSGTGRMIWSIVSVPFVLLGIVWGYGLVLAHDDLSHGAVPMVRLLPKMYGTELNPITRHGYRMYMKHFSVQGDEARTFSGEEVKRRVGSMVNESVSDVYNYFDKHDDRKHRDVMRLREQAADVLGELQK